MYVCSCTGSESQGHQGCLSVQVPVSQVRTFSTMDFRAVGMSSLFLPPHQWRRLCLGNLHPSTSPVDPVLPASRAAQPYCIFRIDIRCRHQGHRPRASRHPGSEPFHMRLSLHLATATCAVAERGQASEPISPSMSPFTPLLSSGTMLKVPTVPCVGCQLSPTTYLVLERY